MEPLDFSKVEDPAQNRWVEPSSRYLVLSEFRSGRYVLQLNDGKHLLTCWRLRDAAERATNHRDRVKRLGYDQIEDLYPPKPAAPQK